MTRTVKQSLAGGELAPELHMRSDLPAYQKGAGVLRNMIVRRTGSAMKRPGTDALNVGIGFGVGQTVRKFSFYYDNSLSFTLLVTNTVVRVFQTSPLFVFDRDFEWTGWTDANVAAMRVKQVGDTLFCSTPGRTPIRMIRQASDGSWTVEDEAETEPVAPTYVFDRSMFISDVEQTVPYQPIYCTYVILAKNEDGMSKEIFRGLLCIGFYRPVPAGYLYVTVNHFIRGTMRTNIPASAVGDTWYLIRCDQQGVQKGVVGTYVVREEDRINGDNLPIFQDLWTDITRLEPVPIQNNTIRVRDGDDEDGYAIVDFHQQRQVLTGNQGSPWSLWFSRLAEIYTWTAVRPTDEMDPFRATIPAMRASEIRHILTGKKLLAFTSDGIYAVHSGDAGFSAGTCQIEKVSPAGAGNALPLDTGTAVLFIADDDRTLCEISYSTSDYAYISIDRSVLARHLTFNGRIISTAWQPYPDGILWAILDNGDILSFTYQPNQGIFSWTRHDITAPEGNIEELLDITSTGSVLTDTKDGSLARYEATTATVILARMADGQLILLRMRRPGAANDCCVDFLRSAVVASGETLTLQIRAGSVWRTDGGTWNISTSADNDDGIIVQGPCTVEWGFPVGGEVETLKPEAPERAVYAVRRRVVNCVIRTLDSGAFTVADVSGDTKAVSCKGDLGNRTTAKDTKVAPFSGWSWDGRLRIESLTPDKLEVLGIVTDIEFERE